MAQSRCCRWFARVCCCCCCMCDDATTSKPLLSPETPPKYSSPAPGKELGISELHVMSEGQGGEVQEMKVEVPDAETTERASTPPLTQDTTDQAPSSPTAATMRRHSGSGSFVRGSGARSSWRMIPTVTQPEQEAESKPEETTPTARETTPTTTTDEAMISFTEGNTGRKLPYRNVVLVTQEVDGDSVLTTAEVTSTITISSQGITVP